MFVVFRKIQTKKRGTFYYMFKNEPLYTNLYDDRNYGTLNSYKQ